MSNFKSPSGTYTVNFMNTFATFKVVDDVAISLESELKKENEDLKRKLEVANRALVTFADNCASDLSLYAADALAEIIRCTEN